MREKIKDICGRYFVRKTRRKKTVNVCTLTNERYEQFVDELTTAFVPPVEQQFLTNKTGYVAAILKSQNAQAHGSNFLLGNNLYEVEGCYANPLEPDVWDVRVLLKNGDGIRSVLTVEQFVTFVKKSVEIQTAFPKGSA